jgi:hypothetical protein
MQQRPEEAETVFPPEKPTSIGYAECGNIDSDGHVMGLRLAPQVQTEVARISEYVQALKAAGWPRVRLVTDHGWLLMPGGFEPIKLPASTVIAKGCPPRGSRGRPRVLALALGQVGADRDAVRRRGVSHWRGTVIARLSLERKFCAI